MRTAITLATILSLVTSHLFAWSDAGHMIVASIAFRRLTAAEQAKIAAILKQHPRFQPDFADKMPDEIKSANAATQNEWLFQQAALWPDYIRDFQDELRDEFHRPFWHYINQPHYLTEADRKQLDGKLWVNASREIPAKARPAMNLIQTIGCARKTIADPKSTAAERALMLSWLFHTVGDIHQPMHSTAVFAPKVLQRGDQGGNLIATTQLGNLHSVWDRFPGGRVPYNVARNKALSLKSDPALAPLGEEAARQLDENAWLDESHKLALAVVYDPEVLAWLRQVELAGDLAAVPPLMLSEEYLKRGGNLSQQRLVQGGFRLGALLKEIASIETSKPR